MIHPWLADSELYDIEKLAIDPNLIDKFIDGLRTKLESSVLLNLEDEAFFEGISDGYRGKMYQDNPHYRTFGSSPRIVNSWNEGYRFGYKIKQMLGISENSETPSPLWENMLQVNQQ